MSDEFDKERRPDDDWDDDLDWLSKADDDPKPGEKSGGRLGFTGELSWRDEMDAAGDKPADDDDDAPEWQTGQPGQSGTPGASGLGFTSQLDWRKLQPDAEGEAGDEPHWLTGLDDDAGQPGQAAPATPAAQADADFLAELRGEPDDSGADYPPEDDSLAQAGGDPLEWLRQYSDPDADAEAPPPAASTGEPEWLEDDDLFDVPVAAHETGEDAPDWLKTTAPPAAAPSEDVPDWLNDLGAEAAVPAGQTDDSQDWFAGLDEALGIGAETAPPPAAPSEEVPDWLRDMGTAAPAASAEPDEAVPDWLRAAAPAQPEQPAGGPPAAPADDIFGELGLPTPDTGYDFLDEPAPAEEAPVDWFAEQQAPAEANAEPDWLGELGDLSAAQAAAPAEDDFLAEVNPQTAFGDYDSFDAPGLDDIDKLLSQYDTELPQVRSSLSSSDIDRLLSDEDLDEISARRDRPPITGLSPDAPDWLTELQSSVGSDDVSAAAIVRGRAERERALDDLDDRLFALHEAGLELPSEAPDSGSAEVIQRLLPGVNQLLPAAPIKAGMPGIAGEIALTGAQREKVQLLRELVGEDDRPLARPAAIDLTLTTPNLDDVAAADEEFPDLDVSAAPAALPDFAPVVLPRLRFRPRVGRLLMAALLTLAVVAPYYLQTLRIGTLPAPVFAAGGQGETAFNRVNAVRTDQVVLVAAEYGPTGAPELDTALDAVVRHLLLRGAKPALVSSNPIGLLHAGNVIEGIATDADFLAGANISALAANDDYYLLRYVAGSAVGLSGLTGDISGLLGTDASGAPTGLRLRSLDDFALIVVIVERAEDARNWAEQVAPRARNPLVMAVGAAAAPLVEPYAQAGSPSRLAGISGLLVGYRDAYTYLRMLEAGLLNSVIPTEVPTQETLTTPTVPLVTPVAPQPTGEAPIDVTALPSPTGEAPIGLTAQPLASTPDSAAPPAPTTDAGQQAVEPAPTLEITPTPGPVIRAVIDANQAVNMREGPGTTFPPIATVEPGTVVQVIGRNADGRWIRIRLDDGTEGWVSESLLAIEEPVIPAGEATPTPESLRNPAGDTVLVLGSGFGVGISPLQQPEATEEPAPEATPDATAEPVTFSVDSGTGAGAWGVRPSTAAQREQRWYSMTLGLGAVILVIALGAIINVLRGLLRRENAK